MSSEETTPISKPTRAAFIRGLPIEMPVEEVIERGRELGLALQPSDIHAARYYMRQAAAAEARDKVDVTLPILRRFNVTTRVRPDSDATATRTEAPVPSPRAVPQIAVNERAASIAREALRGMGAKPGQRESKSMRSLEAQLRELVLRLGTDRTRKLLDDLDKLALQIARRL